MIAYRVPVLGKVLTTLQSRLVTLKRGFTFGRGVSALGWPVLRCVAGAKVSVGERFVMVSDTAFSAVGLSRPCLITAMERGATISIGDDVGMSGAAICCAVSVTIGHRVMLGADVVVADTDFHPIHAIPRRHVSEGVPSAPVTIEDDVFIGMRAIVLKGVRVGRGAVIGAGSVVVTDVPPRAIVAGHPAKVVGRVVVGEE